MEDDKNILAEAFHALEDVTSVPKLMPKRNSKGLGESDTYDLGDKDQVAAGLKALKDSKRKDDSEEKIVDVDANTIDKLKDSYVGNAILQCPVCRTLIYKKPDALEKGGEGDLQGEDVLYNVGEECPHCGSKDGFNLVGQVANMGVADSEPESTTGAPEPVDSDNEAPAEDAIADAGDSEKGDGGFLRTTSTNREEEALSNVSMLDDDRINSLIGQFLESTYSNVKSFKTVCGEVDRSRLVVEGVVTFNSGKTKATKFEFYNAKRTPGGHCRMVGMNSMFSESPKSFGLLGKVDGNAFLGESLYYDYSAGDVKVRGRSYYKSKRS